MDLTPRTLHEPYVTATIFCAPAPSRRYAEPVRDCQLGAPNKPHATAVRHLPAGNRAAGEAHYGLDATPHGPVDAWAVVVPREQATLLGLLLQLDTIVAGETVASPWSASASIFLKLIGAPCWSFGAPCAANSGGRLAFCRRLISPKKLLLQQLVGEVLGR